MKTVRDILMARHQAAEARLDLIRREVVSDLRPRSETTLMIRAGLKLWRELVLPARGVWAGIAGAWLIILGANFTMREPAAPEMAREAALPSPQIRELLREQEALLAELVGPEFQQPAERPKTILPQPRGERRFETCNV